MEKILITGANGFIGSHLTDFLLTMDFEIYALDLPGSQFSNLAQYIRKNYSLKKDKRLKIFGKEIQIPTNHEHIKIIECDLKNNKLLEKIILEIKPVYIFHLGAQSLILPSWEDPISTIEANIIGTINVFEPIKKFNIITRVIIPGTSTEFGTSASIGRPLKETDPLLAVHPYGISKIAAELLGRQYYINFGIECVILRFFNQTGPRKSLGAAADFTRKVAQIELGLAKPIIEVGNLDSYRDFTGIKDTIQALWLAATKGIPGEIYHVCSGKKIQIRKLLEMTLSFSNKKIDVFENISNKVRKYDEDIIIGDNSKIKNELGFKTSQSIEDVLKDMYEYWKQFYKKINP
ncbi:MAG: GDP-mannose 4,6-dehydratase [Promethearchaeota archaeon]